MQPNSREPHSRAPGGNVNDPTASSGMPFTALGRWVLAHARNQSTGPECCPLLGIVTT